MSDFATSPRPITPRPDRPAPTQPRPGTPSPMHPDGPSRPPTRPGVVDVARLVGAVAVAIAESLAGRPT